VIHRRDDRARSDAAAVEVGSQPFAGVPVVIKDLDGTMAGEPYHAGSVHLRDHHYVADTTSVLIERLRSAGFVVVGKTNVPELGLLPSTEPVAYGPSHNPWDTTRTPGGSSGAPRPQSPPGSSPSGTPATEAARSGSPRRSAAWSA
jgi:amidase